MTANETQALSFDELASNANVLILAGSETTATALTAATYYLTRHPEALMKLTAEVRSAFNTEDDIDLLSVQHLTYMLAVLDEAMRLFPPAPLGQPRVIGAGGEMILGQFVPEGVSLTAQRNDYSSYCSIIRRLSKSVSGSCTTIQPSSDSPTTSYRRGGSVTSALSKTREKLLSPFQLVRVTVSARSKSTCCW